MRDAILIPATVLIGAALWTAPAAGFEGRYVGLWAYTDTGAQDSRVLQHRYDATSERTFREGLDGKLHLGLRYRTRPGEEDTELLQSRFQGDLRGGRWRLYGQLAPWQDKTAGGSPPRERYRQAGVEWNVLEGGRVVAEWQRRDEESVFGRSAFNDKRVELAHVIGAYRWNAQWRRLDTGPAGTSDADMKTEEWRGGLAGQHTLGRVTLQTSWQGLTSRLDVREARQETTTHRLNVNSSWRAARTVSVSANALARLGSTELTGHPSRDIDERNLSGGVDWRPWTSLDLRLSRDYRSRESDTGRRTESDYVRAEARFRRPLYRDVIFQTGYERSFDLQDEIGVPRNLAYGRLDGPLRRGLRGSAELRVSESAGSVATGRLWRRLWQLRAEPSHTSRLEVTWQKEDFPEILGVRQTDREWRLLAGFDPFRSAALSGTWVRRNGTGRVEREETLTSLTATWRLASRSSVLIDGTNRSSSVNGRDTTNRVVGTDVTFWFPGEYRIVGSARRSWARGLPVTRSVSVTLEKAFP